MSDRALLQVESGRRRSRHLESPRDFIQRLQAEFRQHADLVLMPKDVLAPEPVVLSPIPPFTSDIGENNPTKPDTSDLNLPSDTSRGRGSAIV